MAKINRVKKSRKEHKCGKCGIVLPIGSEYISASLNFGPTFVRCTKRNNSLRRTIFRYVLNGYREV